MKYIVMEMADFYFTITSVLYRRVFDGCFYQLTYRAQRPTMAPPGGPRAVPPGGQRMQQPNKPLTAEEKKLLDRAKRFADPPAVSVKKRQADGTGNVSPSPPKQVRLASGAQTATVSAAKKITSRAAAVRQQKQQQQQQQQPQPSQAPLLTPAAILQSKPKNIQEEVRWLSDPYFEKGQAI